MRFFKIFIRIILSMPKTILFNLKTFPIKTAIKLPVLIAYNVKIAKIYKGSIQINSKISRFMIKMNIDNGSEGMNNALKKNGYLSINKEGKVIFEGEANFAIGFSMRVDGGEIIFGNNFSSNRHCFISCVNKIIFGNDVLLGWGVNFLDSDGHGLYKIEELDKRTNMAEPIYIGNHVWIGANAHILKGVTIPKDCVVGYNSCVTKRFNKSNCVIAGYPSKVVKEGITWKK